MSKEPGSFKQFLARKNVVFSAKRYGIDALGAMAQGLFASLLMGTILSTLGQQIGFELLVTIGDSTGPVFTAGCRKCCKYFGRCRWSACCFGRDNFCGRMW